MDQRTPPKRPRRRTFVRSELFSTSSSISTWFRETCFNSRPNNHRVGRPRHGRSAVERPRQSRRGRGPGRRRGTAVPVTVHRGDHKRYERPPGSPSGPFSDPAIRAIWDTWITAAPLVTAAQLWRGPGEAGGVDPGWHGDPARPTPLRPAGRRPRDAPVARPAPAIRCVRRSRVRQ